MKDNIRRLQANRGSLFSNFPAGIVKRLNLKEGDFVEFEEKEGRIIATPVVLSAKIEPPVEHQSMEGYGCND